eukprot:15019-Pelagococcus_subviridis.AAC.1
MTSSVASFFIRTRSSCRKHVWSCVTGRTSHLGLTSFSFVGDDARDDCSYDDDSLASSPLAAIPKIALESPTFATCNMSPIKCATTAVVPDDFTSSASSRTMTSFVRSNAVANADGPASSPSSGDAVRGVLYKRMSEWSSKASGGVERRRGRGLKARSRRRDTPGKVLKDRRSPRERG